MHDSQQNTNWILWAAVVTLCISGGTALAMLTAPVGTWLGLWEFGTGFQIMGAVNPWTGWITLFALADGLALYAVARRLSLPEAGRILKLTMSGALACGIAWYIPTTFQAPDGQFYPGIHDVSTDLVDIPQYVAVLPLRANAPNTTVYGGSRNMTPERNAQLQREAYPDLVPMVYPASEEEIFDRALAAVEEMGWELVEANPDEGRIEATATTFWFRFKDDVVIRIRPMGPTTVVDARSLSRVGGGDIGTNAKRLRAFFAIL